jgi:excisionase family DNA binding protein
MSNNSDQSPSTPTMVPVGEVHRLDASWPFGPDRTYQLIKQGRLGCVRVGRRVFLRREDLAAFIAAHVVTGGSR